MAYMTLYAFIWLLPWHPSNITQFKSSHKQAFQPTNWWIHGGGGVAIWYPPPPWIHRFCAERFVWLYERYTAHNRWIHGGGFHSNRAESLIKVAEALMRLRDSLIKLLDGLIQVSNSLLKLSARNQEPRTKIPRKVLLRILVPGTWVED